MFIKLPISIYQPNDQLESMGIDYEADEKVVELNVRVDHIQMYSGDDEATSVWLLGNERANVVELPIYEFELRLNGFMR